MSETIKCPSCGCAIEVTEVLSAQLRTQIRSEIALEWHDRETELAKQRTAIESQQQALAQERLAINQEVDRRMLTAKKRFKVKMLRKVRAAFSAELQAKDNELNEVRNSLQEAKNLELQLRRDRQNLEDDKQNFELIKARELDAERPQSVWRAKTSR